MVQGFPNAAAISVSSNASLTGSGILWTSGSFCNGRWGSGPGVVTAFDATNLANELWDSTQNLARDDVGNYAKYNSPDISNGKVYVGSFSGQLQVYGLNPPHFKGSGSYRSRRPRPSRPRLRYPSPIQHANGGQPKRCNHRLE